MVEATQSSTSTAVIPYNGDPTTPPTTEQRDLIEEELCALAEAYVDAMPTMQVLHEDTALNYESRYVKDNNGHVTCTKYRVPDMDVQMFKDMRPEGLQHQERMSNRMRCWKLETEMPADRDIVVMRTLMPVLISNRIMFSCLYHIERDNGDFISIQSSRGNEFYYKKYGDQIGKDEVANHVISMTKMSPNPEDGSVNLS